MAVAGFASVVSRRVVVAVGLAAVLSTTAIGVSAQQAAAPAAPAAPAQDLFKFTTDAGGFLWQVKAEKATDFENAWKEIRTKLAASDNAEVKALASGLKMYRIAGDPGPQGVSYLFVADPASKTISYNPSPSLLFETKAFADADGRRLFEVLAASSNGINPLSLNVIPAQ